MAQVARFQMEFLRASPPNRAAMIQKVVALNQGNTGIINLLSNVDLNYKKASNPIEEAQQWKRADNIFFICKMLNAFPDFRFQ